MNVFVIDDEREMTELVKLGLKKRGFTVHTYGNGADALAALGQRVKGLPRLDPAYAKRVRRVERERAAPDRGRS